MPQNLKTVDFRRVSRRQSERRSEQQIMGGKDAQPGEHPWAAKLTVQHGQTTGVCGGVLISRRHVLTAGHCFTNSPGECASLNESEALLALSVHIGGVCTAVDKALGCSSDLLGRDYRAKGIVFNRFFDRGCTHGEDIAIVELSKDVDLNVHHICLPHLHESDAFMQQRMTAIGFGIDPENHESYKLAVPRLQKLDVGNIVPTKRCQVEEVPKDVVCSDEKRRANVCEVFFERIRHEVQGDSGGGLLAEYNGRFMLAGLASAGASCNDLFHYGAPGLQTYTSTAYYTAMLDAAIGTRAPKVY